MMINNFVTEISCWRVGELHLHVAIRHVGFWLDQVRSSQFYFLEESSWIGLGSNQVGLI
jgi:hypothetical protein